MPSPDPHPFDAIADEVSRWLTEDAQWYADALRGSYRSPFAAPVTEDQKLDYYRRQMFSENPDGSVNYERPNTKGREQLLQRLGVRGYAEVVAATKPPQGLRPPVEPNYDPTLAPPMEGPEPPY
jgi:hypothetical protein